MEKQLKKKLNWKKRIGLVLLFLLVVIAGGSVWYVNDYYHADADETAPYLKSDDTVTVTGIGNGLFFDGKGETEALIFYPGAKVEYTAYAPLMYELASQGIDCFLLHMPCNLAIFGVNRADDILDTYDYEHWYLAGHSLGGAMAADYAAKHTEDLTGLVLLAAYPTKDLRDSGLKVLTVYGSEDGVLNREKLEDGKALLPENATEVCIEGGNHAIFADYGKQKGDGEPLITGQSQKQQTVDAIRLLLNGADQ
ncbi:MAG: alpha/beta hydrolase [Lachnospiraceae bacterium]|nr:alpha/beta hydrolase [Lachnospiraceae bacterium]